jgi:hypothetical protein
MEGENPYFRRPEFTPSSGTVVDPGSSGRGPLGRPWASHRAEGKGWLGRSRKQPTINLQIQISSHFQNLS